MLRDLRHGWSWFDAYQEPLGLNPHPEHLAVADPLVTGDNSRSTDAGSGGGVVLFAGLDQFDFDLLEPSDSTVQHGDDALSPALKLGLGTELESFSGAKAFASFSVLDGFFSDRGQDDGGTPLLARGSDDRTAAGSDDAIGPGDTVSGASAAADARVVPIASAFAAKGGKPGKPGGSNDDSGSGDGGGSDSDGVVSEYFSGSADGDAGYDIWLDFKGGGWTVELQTAFTATADYLTTVITDDIGGGGRYRGKTIDDIYVTAELATIDGAGDILGQAGPAAVWTANDLTAAGKMEFDVADASDYLDRGLWDDLVTHEFFHVLGFGSLWNYGDHALVENDQYIGPQALDAYRDAQGNQSLTFIPVEDDGGSGTAGAHWDEQALGNELMTGYINDDGVAGTNNDNSLSEFSVMALADLGYAVSYQDYPYDDGFWIG